MIRGTKPFCAKFASFFDSRKLITGDHGNSLPILHCQPILAKNFGTPTSYLSYFDLKGRYEILL